VSVALLHESHGNRDWKRQRRDEDVRRGGCIKIKHYGGFYEYT